MLDRAFASAVVIALTSAAADACPPALRLAGDAELIAQIGDLLAVRGIAIAAADDPTPCPTVAAQVERRDERIVVTVGSDERDVTSAATAASVLESHVSRVESPLLATREVPPPPVVVAPAPAPVDDAPRGVHVYAGLESSLASDRSGWLGMNIGACVMVGPVCLAARFRTNVGVSDGEELQRHIRDFLLGVDVPFSLGRWLIVPGVAFGPSWMTAKGDGAYHESDLLRAEAYTTFSMPLTPRFGLDVQFAVSLLQQVHDDVMTGAIPAEPWGFARVGVALRYGTR